MNPSRLRADKTTDAIMDGPWMPSLGTERTMGGCSLLRTDETTDAIMIGPWVLSSLNTLDQGHHHFWAMDAFRLRTKFRTD